MRWVVSDDGRIENIHRQLADVQTQLDTRLMDWEVSLVGEIGRKATIPGASASPGKRIASLVEAAGKSTADALVALKEAGPTSSSSEVTATTEAARSSLDGINKCALTPTPEY
jgi:hypothetical protein